MIILTVEMTAEQKVPGSPEAKDYLALITAVLNLDMLNNYPCANNALCLEEYMQLVYRWSFYFTGPQLCQLIANTYFSDKTIKSNNPSVVKAACQTLNRICVKNMAELIKHHDYIMQLVQQVVETIDKLTTQL